MNPSRRSSARLLTVEICMLYCGMCLAGWPLSSEAARLRCGSELLSDLMFVCGDRGIYLGKGTWSGYGARPRGKGIVDKCCRSSGCDLHHLEMYCAKPKRQQQTTTDPTTTAAYPTTAFPTTTTACPTTTAAPHMAAPTDTAQQFQAVFQRRLAEHLGRPDSPKREAYRKKKRPSVQRRGRVSSSRRRMKSQRSTPSTSRRPLHRTTASVPSSP